MKYDIAEHLFNNGLIPERDKMLVKDCLSGLVIPHNQVQREHERKLQYSAAPVDFTTDDDIKICIYESDDDGKTPMKIDCAREIDTDVNQSLIAIFSGDSVDITEDAIIGVVAENGYYQITKSSEDKGGLRLVHYDNEALDSALDILEKNDIGVVLMIDEDVFREVGIVPDEAVDIHAGNTSPVFIEYFATCLRDKEKFEEMANNALGIEPKSKTL